LPKQVLFDRDEQLDKGPLEGIRVGLKRLSGSTKYAFVTSCDVPLLKTALVRHLHKLIENHDAVVPRIEDRVFGMTAIYRTDLHERIAQRISANQLRVSDLADAFDSFSPGAELLKATDPDLDSMTNINSAIDYQKLLNRFGLDYPPEIAIRIDDAR
jgi:molybdopterin-guanine dinucleotide biosynthesis protein A